MASKFRLKRLAARLAKRSASVLADSKLTTLVSSSTLTVKQPENIVTVATPTCVPNGGAVLLPQTFNLTCLTGGSTIYYTLDGSTPTSDKGTKYTGVVSLSVLPTTVKAIGWKLGCATSAVMTKTFTLLQ